MKYSLRSLMTAVLVMPPLLAWGWSAIESIRRERSSVTVDLEQLKLAVSEYRHDYGEYKPSPGEQ